MAKIEGLKYMSTRNRSCFVYGCFSTAANKLHLGFHKFPAKGKRNIVVVKKNGDNCIYDRRQLWIEALNIGREAALAIDAVNLYVCSLHFAREDFYYNQDITGRRYLKEFAIPRRNLPARKSSPLTTRFSVRCLHRLKYRGYFNIHNPDGRKLTAPRRFLGARQFGNGSVAPSYTKTVWVVRKPKEDQDQGAAVKDGVDNVSVVNSFSLADNAQSEDSMEETDNEQCTILSEATDQQPGSQWFTSELIIKEEPISDSEQESLEPGPNKELKTGNKVLYETTIEDDEDINYEPDKLVIQSEDEEEHQLQLDMEEIETTEMNEEEPMYADEEVQENREALQTEEVDSLDQTDLDEYEPTEEETLEYFENNEEIVKPSGEEHASQSQDYDVTVVHVDNEDEEYAEGEIQPKENYFVCLICSDIFPSQNHLALHSLSHENMTDEEYFLNEERAKSLTCEFCGRVLSTKATLREHIMIHTGEKPHQCLLCGKCFRHKANLVVHVNGHAVVSTYKCKKCSKAFTKKMDFEEHLKFHVDASGNPLVCTICNAVFKSQRTLYNHSQLHSRKGNVRAKKRNGFPKDPVHVCKTCGRVLSTKATLKEHMMIHTGEKPHVCNICGRTIRHKANYVVHIQTHGQGKSFECDMCDEAFMRKLDLTQHKQQVHSKSKLLRCPICSEVFKSPQKFNRHMEIHESVVYMNETEELVHMNENGLLDYLKEDYYEDGAGLEPHLLEGYLENS